MSKPLFEIKQEEDRIVIISRNLDGEILSREEITGYDAEKIKETCKDLIELLILILWITQNIRKIKPTAPDEAIEKTADSSRQYVLD
jgi:hypothetical protein